ncbi:MAG: hypothetical protein AAGD43_06795 [Pseudomonadota bacterium]
MPGHGHKGKGKGGYKKPGALGRGLMKLSKVPVKSKGGRKKGK